MSEPYLTLKEMERRHWNEWVLITRPRLDRNHEVVGGYVLFHTPDRAALDRRLLTLRDDECVPMIACFYLGEHVFDETDLPEPAELRQAQ